MHYEIDLQRMEPTFTAVVRGRLPRQELPRFIPAACGEVWTFIRAASLPKPGRHIALYQDEEGSLEVGAEVSEPFTGDERVQCSRLPEGRAVHTVHMGPYPGLSAAHRAIREWCSAQGLRRSGVALELYGHWQEAWNADPALIRTDVYHLLEDAPADR